MSNVKVSVIMTVYNGEKYLTSAISSILNQSYKNFEFLIFNDGSKDRTLEILNSFNDSRVKIINVGKLGRAKALNYLLNIAKGEFIANIDADDVSKPNRLETQIKYLEHNPHVVLISTGTELINSNSEKITISKRDNVVVANELLGRNCPINHSSVMYRLTDARLAGNYNEQLYKQIDYEFWIRLAKQGELHIIPDVLASKRLHNEQSFERSGLKYQMHAIKIQKMAIRELDLSKKNYLYVLLRYIYYLFGLNKILDRSLNVKIQEWIFGK